MFISRENRRGSAKELGTSETIMAFLERQLLLCPYVNSPNHKVAWDLSFLSATIRFWRHFFQEAFAHHPLEFLQISILPTAAFYQRVPTDDVFNIYVCISFH